MTRLTFTSSRVWCKIMIAFLSLMLSLHANEGIYEFSGRHFLASYLDCDSNAMSDLQNLMEAMDEAVKASGATILEKSSYVFPPNGVTVVYLLSESHASLHTYPEFGSCFVDLFTCGNKCSSETFDKVLRAYLKPEKVDIRLFQRNEETLDLPYMLVPPESCPKGLH